MRLNRKGLIKLSVFLFFALVVAWLAFGDRGLIHLYRMEGQRQRYQARIRELERKNHELLMEIERLRTDEAYIESVARKELNLLKDQETHFRFPEKHTAGVTPPGRPRGGAVQQEAPGESPPGPSGSAGSN